jgi:hypothetical protein
METFADRAISFYEKLANQANLPSGISAMNPYESPEVQRIGREFYGTFFNDTRPRIFMVGINPGRFGAGLTGLSFTAPNELKTHCGIQSTLPPTSEVSSRFIYRIITELGGPSAFYSRFFLTSLYPLALVKNGKNYNVYEDATTVKTLWPDIARFVRQQLAFGCDRRVAICLGRKNETFLKRLNAEQKFFDQIITLDHPRYILQYQTKAVDEYVKQYMDALARAVSY